MPMKIISINPFNNEKLKEYALLTPQQLDAKLTKSQQSFETWRFSTLEKRIACLKRLSQLLQEQKDNLAKTITLEMGKLLTEATAEIEKCATLCEYYAEHVMDFLKPKLIKTSAHKSYVVYQPIGIILGIMPWNFPYWQVFRCAVPSIMLGNTVVLKHALNVPASALDIERLFHEAGFPENVYTNLFLDNEATTNLLNDSRIMAASLTGSDRAGRSVAAQAGKNLKKTVLELGGSDPFIVLDDVKISNIINEAVVARFQNAGQSCIAAKRFIILSSIADDFIEQFKNKIEQLKAADPLLASTTLAPMARFDLRDSIAEQLQKSVQQGAKIITGGKKLEAEGAFYAASLISNIPDNSPAACEELFGPVACIFVAKDIKEVIKLANKTHYGLGASIWTNDIDKGELIADQIQAGMVSINSMVKSYPELPFGGIKQSGYGRELSEIGLHEFANCKTILINPRKSS